MCGITGLLHYSDPNRPIDRSLLRAMTDSLAHRGPDGDGVWDAPGVGLGHRRLAILDLTANARQPMQDSLGQLVITFNGEIYNFRELRSDLELAGHTFRSNSDTEVILAAYREWDEEVIQRLSGIYAFAIWDCMRRRLFLARDPLGVKPLFYSDDGRTFRFGSEIKAILTDAAVDREFDAAALDAFLTFGYTPAPATGFRSVRQLLPGHLAVVDQHGVRISRFWQTPYEPQPANVDFTSALAEFSDRLDGVVKAQMVSDVPLGCFLSGGLDSAAIARSMRRAGADVHALTVGFDVASFDERAAARCTAAALDVRLEEQELSVNAAALLPELSKHVEEPTADSSMLPVFLLCRAARQRFTVAMSGDGADEILAGYETYRATAWARWFRLLPRFLRRNVLAPLAGWLPATDRKYSMRQVAVRFVHGAELGRGRDHCGWRTIFSDVLKRRAYAGGFRERTSRLDPLGQYASHVNAVPPGREALCGLLNADTEFYLPNDMLIKVDRMSMACGLEVRVPFLDVDFVRFCANLPGAFKLHRGKARKHILRESLRRDIPRQVLDRPKSGFNVPLESWMRGSLGDLLVDAVTTRSHELSEFLNIGEVLAMHREHQERRGDHAHALFAVLMLALWFENRNKAWRPELQAVRQRDAFAYAAS